MVALGADMSRGPHENQIPRLNSNTLENHEADVTGDEEGRRQETVREEGGEREREQDHHQKRINVDGPQLAPTVRSGSRNPPRELDAWHGLRRRSNGSATPAPPAAAAYHGAARLR